MKQPEVRFSLNGYIDAEVAETFIHSLWEADGNDSQAVWEVVVNTEGGDMEAGTAIFSELRSYSIRGGGTHHVVVRVRGQAASCGSLIVQAGDYRIAGKLDYLMLHEPVMTFEDAPLARVEVELAQAKSWTRNFIDIVMERGRLARWEIEMGMNGRDWWLSGAEALEVGLIDEVA